MSDVELPAEEEPVEAPEEAEEAVLEEVPEDPGETPEELVEAAEGRVRWEDENGDEFFAGPGETVPEDAEPV